MPAIAALDAENLLRPSLEADQSDRTLQGLHWNREIRRGMSSYELETLIRRHLHPRWWSFGIESSRHGANRRKEVGMHADCGTIWFATPTEQTSAYIVPRGSIPYFPQDLPDFDNPEDAYDDNPAFLRYNRHSVRGWRGLFEDLVREGYLRAHRHLSFLVGKDTAELAHPRWYVP